MNRTGISQMTARAVVYGSRVMKFLDFRWSCDRMQRFRCWRTTPARGSLAPEHVLCCSVREKAVNPSQPDAEARRARDEEGDVTGAIAPTKPLTALDVCDRCGAQAYVRVLLPNSGELLFCAHHSREHLPALKKVAVDIQDETQRLNEPEKD